MTQVLYPLLPSHPQHDLARAQMSGGGTVVTFELDGGKDEAFALHERPVGHRHLQQPRRRQVAGHPPRDDDAPAPDARGASRGGHHRRRRCGSRSASRTSPDLVDDLERPSRWSSRDRRSPSRSLALRSCDPAHGATLAYVRRPGQTGPGACSGSVSGEPRTRAPAARPRRRTAPLAREVPVLDREFGGPAALAPTAASRARPTSSPAAPTLTPMSRAIRRAGAFATRPLQREVGRQVVDDVGGQRADAADARRSRGAVPCPHDRGEHRSSPRSQARLDDDEQDRRCPGPSATAPSPGAAAGGRATRRPRRPVRRRPTTARQAGGTPSDEQRTEQRRSTPPRPAAAPGRAARGRRHVVPAPSRVGAAARARRLSRRSPPAPARQAAYVAAEPDAQAVRTGAGPAGS